MKHSKSASKTFITTAVASLGILHFINKSIDSASAVNTAVKSTDQYYHWKHGDIFYKVSGHGEPLLLIHDLTVFSSGCDWTQLASSLSDSYTVYTVDLIGCGKSSKPAVTYTNYFYVQMICDFVKNVIARETKVAAAGLSGSFVLMANLLDSALFDEIMLINPKSIDSLKLSPTEKSGFLLKFFDMPIIGKTAYYIAVNRNNTSCFLNQKLFYGQQSVKSGMVKAYYDAAHTSNGNGRYLFASLQGNYLNADITKALSNTDKRIVIVNGLHDENRISVFAAYKKINPRLVHEVISDSKLLPQLENIGEMLELLYTF